MCTATWFFEPDGFHLFFNRDERHSRAAGRPPEVDRTSGVRFVAPRDGDFGGSWIAVNERGVALAILNGYRTADDSEPPDNRSRGLLLTDLASSTSLSALEARLSGLSLSPYRSFRLLALAPNGRVMIAEWDRVALELDREARERRPLVSSSFEESDVGSKRRATFAAEVNTVRPRRRDFEDYHRSHTHGPSAFSVCMHREDARSQSFTRIHSTMAGSTLIYHAGPPCESAAEFSVSLEPGAEPGFP